MSTLRVPVTAADHVLGDEDAAVTMVEYGDYECPHCAAAQPHVKLLLTQLGRQLRFAFRHFPMTEIHPHAQSAAESAEFAGAHGSFWQMHDLIFENQDRLGLPLLSSLVESIGLSAFALRDALTRGVYRPKVLNDFMGGVRSGVNGTPTFFINGQRHEGPYDFQSLLAALSLALE
jgi:protein-disulfide isomerase